MKKLLLLIIFIHSLISFGCVTTPKAGEVKKSQNDTSAARLMTYPIDASIYELPRLYRIGAGISITKEDPTPISVGDVIYVAGVDVLRAKIYTPYNQTYTYEYIRQSTVTYRYSGIDDENNLKINYSYEYNPHKTTKGFGPKLPYAEDTLPKSSESFDLLLPLNQKKQTALKVKSFELNPKLSIISERELIITVVDEFYRITAEAKKSQNEALAPRQHKPHSRIVGGVNKDQPISIGEMIYSESVGAGAGFEVERGVFEYQLQQSVSYSYMGLDDKYNVKIIYRYESGPGPIWREKSRISPQVETVGLLFPLNPKKQTMVKVKSFELDPEWRSSIVSKKELIITVVDEFYRITVEEIGDTQTK